ncbi:class I SAM-dependent methyltransferase [Thiocapsa sp.]|uniref:class I SAM-dependent methyltransferase n=1 Tax=Thiocapsa sp. TaxID=2024551 RepID=UPI002CF94AE4|nr:class I SAM-dependent methyltransferase [Thiocapsa sp.]HSO82195.1 class I SAM-dependent methyltransferase [Thiocapsa sp.]
MTANFDGADFHNKADGFSDPTQRPVSPEQRLIWQEANRSWWSSNPMRYDWRSEIPWPRYSPEYFAEIDARFFDSARHYMPWQELPFEREIPYGELPRLDVLEIGVGQGSHAGLIAPRAQSFTGIDLTAPAIEATSRRLEQMGLTNVQILQMDAEEMAFPDASFDFI